MGKIKFPKINKNKKKQKDLLKNYYLKKFIL